MSTTVWFRGKSRTFEDEDEADEWVKEIDMARKEKRAPKASPTAVAKAKPIKGDEDGFTVTAPANCSLRDCGITFGENNTGGFYVTHRSRGGNLISGSFRYGEDPAAWLEKVHAEES